MLKGVLLAFLAYAVFAISDASVKLLKGGLNAYEIIFWGALMGFTILPLVRRPGERYRDVFSASDWRLWIMRAVAALAGSLGSVMAFTWLPMAEAFALLFLLPAFVTILSVVLLKEHVGWRRWGAVAMGFIGVLVVLRPGFRELNPGHAGALMGALASAVTIVMLRALGAREKRVSLYGAGLVGPLLGGFIMMLPGFLWPSLEQWVFLLGYGMLAAAGNALLMLASALAPASLVAPPQYSQMIWAIGFGHWVFHDRLDAPMILGVAIIIGAGAITFLREKKREPKGWRRTPLIHPQ
ncbi:DMT family transporter [Pseudoroseomonas oryzae]|uniref:DMT family transporter n=1 Tax=Teichococcus oryzae TaxID=1608942 RepID=A0A5B2TFS4_9PROT|nr:DMT family transporter [Pseudoroseomonas oryzae]